MKENNKIPILTPEKLEKLKKESPKLYESIKSNMETRKKFHDLIKSGRGIWSQIKIKPAENFYYKTKVGEVKCKAKSLEYKEQNGIETFTGVISEKGNYSRIDQIDIL